MKEEANDTQIGTAREVLDVLRYHGVKDFVMSPGSRNTPLLIGAKTRFGVHIINDERIASFTALGMAMASKKPVALVCTSGTALYNYSPAIAEAYYQHIPLIVISADRPSHWIGQENQTLKQPDAFSGIIKKSFNIPDIIDKAQSENTSEKESDLVWFANRVANEAFNCSVSDIPGPVHINMEFNIPFNGTCRFHDSKPRLIEIINNTSALPIERIKEIIKETSEKKIMVFAGNMLSDNKLTKALREFSKLENTVIACEPLSNLHIGDDAISADKAIDIINACPSEHLDPDLIISLGGIPVSEQVKTYVRNLKNCEIWTLADNDYSLDWSKHLSRHYNIRPELFLRPVASVAKYMRRKGMLSTHSEYREKWESLKKCFDQNLENKDQSDEFSESKAYKTIFQNLPLNCNVFLSNGLTVRYACKYMKEIPHNCWGNRGVSGIEGTNATAFGASLKYEGTTVLITGDMSFSYCPEILYFSKYGGDLRIIVINNCGGGIFRKINTTRSLDCRENIFCNSPDLPLESLAEAYHWNYRRAVSETDLNESIRYLMSNPKTIIEVMIEKSWELKE